MDRRRIQVSIDGRTAVFGPGLPEILVGREAACFVRPAGTMSSRLAVGST